MTAGLWHFLKRYVQRRSEWMRESQHRSLRLLDTDFSWSQEFRAKLGRAPLGNFQAALVWAIWTASSCRIFWNKEGFFIIRGWPRSTAILHGLRSNTGLCVFSIFLRFISCLSSGGCTPSRGRNWDWYHLQTSQTKGFIRGQSGLF